LNIEQLNLLNNIEQQRPLLNEEEITAYI